MRIFILCILSILTVGTSFSQNPNIIRTWQFKGAIFNSDYNTYFTEHLTDDFRFTPTIEEVKLLEEKLRKQIKQINKDRLNQGKKEGPVIHRNLRKYARQYIGTINEKGERIISVNFIWNRRNIIELILGYEKHNWKKDWLTIFDGGSHYWKIDFNLTTGEFSGFSVNGIA